MISDNPHKLLGSIFIEFYITPRSVNYGFGDKGIFKFSMNQKSIRVPYSKRSYMTTTRVDSVYELYYFKDTVDKSFSEIFNIDTTAIVNDDFLYPRILILVHQESNIDTFAINKNLTMTRKTISGNTAEIWHQINTDFVTGNNLHDYHVLIQYENHDIEFDMVSSPGGSFEGGYDTTTLSAPLPTHTPFRFAIFPEDFLNKIGKLFGMQDVITGFKEFDENVIVQTHWFLNPRCPRFARHADIPVSPTE